MRFFCIIFLLACFSASPSFAGKADKLVTILNQGRAKHNVRLLNESPKLSAAAHAHALDMERQNYFSHAGKDGSDFWQRILRQNYNPCFAAENIAQGQSTAAQAYQDWTDSKGHHENNISPKPTEYGVGHVGNTWVMLFARPC